MPRKPAQDKWDSANMASLTVRVKRALLDDFKAACVARGDAVNGVMREAMKQYTYGANGSDGSGNVIGAGGGHGVGRDDEPAE